MSAPTPGPWLVSRSNARVHNPDAGEEGVCVARCSGDLFDPDSFDECLANATLIASAPTLAAVAGELLGALQRAHYIRDRLDGNAAAQAWDKWIRTSSEAIANAERAGVKA